MAFYFLKSWIVDTTNLTMFLLFPRIIIHLIVIVWGQLFVHCSIPTTFTSCNELIKYIIRRYIICLNLTLVGSCSASPVKHIRNPFLFVYRLLLIIGADVAETVNYITIVMYTKQKIIIFDAVFTKIIKLTVRLPLILSSGLLLRYRHHGRDIILSSCSKVGKFMRVINSS